MTDAPTPQKQEVFVCTNQRVSGSSCLARGSGIVLRALNACALKRGSPVKVETSICMGYCQTGPNVKILGGQFYHQVALEDVEEIIIAAEQKHAEERGKA